VIVVCYVALGVLRAGALPLHLCVLAYASGGLAGWLIASAPLCIGMCLWGSCGLAHCLCTFVYWHMPLGVLRVGSVPQGFHSRGDSRSGSSDPQCLLVSSRLALFVLDRRCCLIGPGWAEVFSFGFPLKKMLSLWPPRERTTFSLWQMSNIAPKTL
jgi:hypothetical protein